MATKKDGSKVLGTGMARKAAEEIKKAKKQKRNRLSIIEDEMRKTRGGK